MADGKTHKLIGMAAGGLAALGTSDPELSSEIHLREVVGGILGGYLGGKLPDLVEPAIHSWHRKFFHSVGAAAGILEAGRRLTSEAQSRLRETARRASDRRQVEADFWEHARLALIEIGCGLASGAIPGIVAGYLSHLALDATTPRGIPLI